MKRGDETRRDETSGSEGKEGEEEEEEEEQVTIKKEVRIQTVLPACSFRTYEYEYGVLALQAMVQHGLSLRP